MLESHTRRFIQRFEEIVIVETRGELFIFNYLKIAEAQLKNFVVDEIQLLLVKI